jgi:hypothetical protein
MSCQWRPNANLNRYTCLPPLDSALACALPGQATYSEYDRMSALELFRSAGVSPRLYSDFLDPILQVGGWARTARGGRHGVCMPCWCDPPEAPGMKVPSKPHVLSLQNLTPASHQ